MCTEKFRRPKTDENDLQNESQKILWKNAHLSLGKGINFAKTAFVFFSDR